ncbi:6-phosphofructokinase [Schaalia sp. 19OD2882]|uniref:6-phosphofructokinase n=1 Tax=Schaalia sp. 19OD2882 TaxID=2794089 RepID=UPI001C1F1478|nr:6-phosphofructokinase [Schaalia sp. 19OD2882]QWW19183.1 6-phosphofructokinase [Schaalia sp. 19OD2882]
MEQSAPGTGVRIGVLTSGGDAQGMNAAVRAVIRTALAHGAQPYAIYEGWSGAVAGGSAIRPMDWASASNILHAGGTLIGTARCDEFREYSGRHQAARHLLEHDIDRLVVIGGDGSLSGTNEFREEWPQHVAELVAEGVIDEERAAAHPRLVVVGLVGSIDNDLVGTDMTIGADTALHRIIDAIDQISSTAASHQRTFIVEVMGRHCGYLPLMAAVAGGADHVFTPEDPARPGWEDEMTERLQLGRKAGRRESIILVAEGATDHEGNDLTTAHIAQALKERTGETARITILGHVQRGGSPSAYDRWMSTLLGYAAVQEIFDSQDQEEACILGVRRNRLTRIPLMKAVTDTRAVKDLVARGDFEAAQAARGTSFTTMVRINEILSRPPQLMERPAEGTKRVAIIHVGGLAPGMNTAARTAVRLGIARGWTMLGVEGSWAGLSENKVREMSWSDVEGWEFRGGAELGTRRPVPAVEEYYSIGRAIERNDIDALIVIGGMNAYLGAHAMDAEKGRYPAFRIPTVLVPATIDNNVPGAELAIGADTALNNAIWTLDRIKESAAASRRCFVARIMGRTCGYLTLMSGIASGAEYAYLNEEPVTLERIDVDAKKMRASFEEGRRLFLAVVNEDNDTHYTSEFLASAFEAEGRGLFDVRHSSVGHLLQGGTPSPFDRLLATRLAANALDEVAAQFESGKPRSVYIGQVEGENSVRPVDRMFEDLDVPHHRPFVQWWEELRPVLSTVSFKDPEAEFIPVTIHDQPGGGS